MTKITIHGFAPSTYTRTARMAALEKGLEHELAPVPFGQPGHFALHPFGRLPILVHGDQTVYETLAIVSYLDEAFEGEPLVPAEPGRRRQTLQAVSVALDYAYDELVRHDLGDDAEGPDPDRLTRVLDWLEARARLARGLAGNGFGAADLFFAPMLDYHRAKHGDKEIAARPALAAWFEAAAARPSFTRTAS